MNKLNYIYFIIIFLLSFVLYCDDKVFAYYNKFTLRCETKYLKCKNSRSLVILKC